MKKIKVLYIDDEKVNLLAFKSSFRRVYEVYIAENAEEGIAILKQQPIEIIIADQRMPKTTGVAFFESILDIYPNPIRILLTGYSDINAVIDAINKGKVYRYLSKPWVEQELKLIIENAHQLYHLKEEHTKLQTQYQKVFKESSDAILLFGSDGAIINCNSAALKLFECIDFQFNLADYITNSTETMFVLKTLANTGFIDNYELQFTIKNSKKSCLISANKISDNYGNLVYNQAIIKDITQINKLNKMILNTVVNTQEKERARISRDLHDGIGQSLVGIKFHIEALKSEVDDAQKKHIKKISGELVTTIQQLRSICYDILPPALSNFGLQKAIKNLCHNYSTPETQIILKSHFPPNQLNKKLEITVYRIVQEFINNSLKHANCNLIEIEMKISNDHLFLTLRDDGKGFDIDDKHSGLGLKNIISRVDSFDGNANFVSNIEGTVFKIDFPILIKKNKL